jgi:hypothetical protein
VETPDGEGKQELEIRTGQDSVFFRVPRLKVYDLVLLRLERQ